MARIPRMFEIIQELRAARGPVLAEELAGRLEVSTRTIYRDIAALQAMRVPVEGAAGVGYIMRRGYDLPPLNFDAEEIDALRVGLMMLARTGDSALQKAAERITAKIDALGDLENGLHVAPWGVPVDDPANGCVSFSMLRGAIREAEMLRITYRNEAGDETTRTIRPVALIYNLEAAVLAAWCDMRGAFRHFRTDRIWGCEVVEGGFKDQAPALRALWQAHEQITRPS